jgi:hypothetical protein
MTELLVEFAQWMWLLDYSVKPESRELVASFLKYKEAKCIEFGRKKK